MKEQEQSKKKKEERERRKKEKEGKRRQEDKEGRGHLVLEDKPNSETSS